MRPLVEEIKTSREPEAILASAGLRRGAMLLRSGNFESPRARCSFLVSDPFLVFRSSGSECTVEAEQTTRSFGNPWRVLSELMQRFELLDHIDLPFPLGGCFGFWGYDLKDFAAPKLSRKAERDLDLPDCFAGFYRSVLVFDHRRGQTWIVSTGLDSDGSRSCARATDEVARWRHWIESPAPPEQIRHGTGAEIRSNISREQFIAAVRRAQEYIRAGDIYQVNLSHRLETAWPGSGWNLFLALRDSSPAPHAAYMHCGDFEIASASPELFLRMSGSHIETRPIKGTRPRAADPARDAQLAYELQTSGKEISELVMITDLLRNDLGRVCEYGSIQTPDLLRLERFPQVQHLVSTVEGRLRPHVSHFHAFASCFPGGSITGAPKIRAMQIIDELEPVARGPYTGALGYLGFNRESQLAITIRTAICRNQKAYFNVGAGIVSESSPEFEYEETLAKARGFIDAVSRASLDPQGISQLS